MLPSIPQVVITDSETSPGSESRALRKPAFHCDFLAVGSVSIPSCCNIGPEAHLFSFVTQPTGAERREQETHSNVDRAAEADKRMLEDACLAPSPCCAAAHQHTATRCMSMHTNTHALTCDPTHAQTRARVRARSGIAVVSMRHSSRMVASQHCY